MTVRNSREESMEQPHQTRYDFVEVEDISETSTVIRGRWCGHKEIPPRITSRTNQIKITFKSDDYFVAKPGFKIYYSVVGVSYHSPSVTDPTLTADTLDKTIAEFDTVEDLLKHFNPESWQEDLENLYLDTPHYRGRSYHDRKSKVDLDRLNDDVKRYSCTPRNYSVNLREELKVTNVVFFPRCLLVQRCGGNCGCGTVSWKSCTCNSGKTVKKYHEIGSQRKVDLLPLPRLSTPFKKPVQTEAVVASCPYFVMEEDSLAQLAGDVQPKSNQHQLGAVRLRPEPRTCSDGRMVELVPFAVPIGGDKTLLVWELSSGPTAEALKSSPSLAFCIRSESSKTQSSQTAGPGFYSIIKFYSARDAHRAQKACDRKQLFQTSPVKWVVKKDHQEVVLPSHKCRSPGVGMAEEPLDKLEEGSLSFLMKRKVTQKLAIQKAMTDEFQKLLIVVLESGKIAVAYRPCEEVTDARTEEELQDLIQYFSSADHASLIDVAFALASKKHLARVDKESCLCGCSVNSACLLVWSSLGTQVSAGSTRALHESSQGLPMAPYGICQAYQESLKCDP
ncbi:hypothetical protein EI555_011088 [Monodon monoceros]|uniref:Uncharacterized protein n=1 Tax=Monodon monoceros TaxID=40151 RepID=A0A4U1ESH3_MONMO|nr:hypothetical protein EI555_011088 [Monodon monoceros]